MQHIMWVESHSYRKKSAPSTQFQVKEVFLLLWPTALGILPFKVRSHCVSPYPWASMIPLSHEGSPGAPESLFYKLSPASHAITSAENFHAGSFPAALKRNTSWWSFILRFVCRSFYTSALHTWITAGPVKWNNTRHARRDFPKKGRVMNACWLYSHGVVTSVRLSRAALCFYLKHTGLCLWNPSRFYLTPWGVKQYNSLYFSPFSWDCQSSVNIGSPHNPSQC